MAGEIDEAIVIAAPASVVWSTLVDAHRRRHWWPYLELDAVIGGRLVERWSRPDGTEVTTSGSVRDVVADRLLCVRWADDDWPAETEVTITVTPTGGGTTVRVRHVGRRQLRDGERLAADHRAGWRVHLTNLRDHAEVAAADEVIDPS
jgi:uncharacterized protein YndB with AHSA1/START domain